MNLANSAALKAIWGVVLMVNLSLVPFYNAAIAEGNNTPVPYTPENTPEWSFGSAEDGAGVARVAAGVMGVVGMVGMEAEVKLQPEAEDHVLKDMFDFQEQAFETVFGRAYEEEDACYLFDQPLDESTYGTVVLGWNAADEPVDALVLLATPIDVSIFVSLDNEVTIISAAHIAGTLESVGKQSFWGISIVYGDSDGAQYHTLILLSELSATTEEMLMIETGLLSSPCDPGGETQDRSTQCDEELMMCKQGACLGLLACLARADAAYDRCLGDVISLGLGGSKGHSSRGGPAIPIIICGIGLYVGYKVLACMLSYQDEYKGCALDYERDLLDCERTYDRCVPRDYGDIK